MISELSGENCGLLRQNGGAPVLVAYLNQNAYSRQLKALIELSDYFTDKLKIYVTRDVGLRASAGTKITGTPTYLLLRNDLEQDRLLGEADAKRLKKFVSLHLSQSPGAASPAAGRNARPPDSQGAPGAR